MNKRKPTYFRNSLDLRDKVQVKVLRKRLKLSDEQFANIVRKSGNSITAIIKEATTSRSGELPAAAAIVPALRGTMPIQTKLRTKSALP